jgi:hypothetical protein
MRYLQIPCPERDKPPFSRRTMELEMAERG